MTPYFGRFDPPQKTRPSFQSKQGPHLGSIGIFFLLEFMVMKIPRIFDAANKTPHPQNFTDIRGDFKKTVDFFAFARLPCLDFFVWENGIETKNDHPSSAESHRIKNI